MAKENKYKRLRTCYKDVNIIYEKTNAFSSLTYIGLETPNTIEAASNMMLNSEFEFSDKPVNSTVNDCKNNTRKFLSTYIMNILFDNNNEPIWEEWNELLEPEVIDTVKNCPEKNLSPYLFKKIIERDLLGEYELFKEYGKSQKFKESATDLLIFRNLDINENTIAMMFTKDSPNLQLAKSSQKIFQNKDLLTQLLSMYYVLTLIPEEMACKTSNISICYDICEALKGKKTAYIYIKDIECGYKINVNVESFRNSFDCESIFTPIGISYLIKNQNLGDKNIYYDMCNKHNLANNLDFLPYDYLDKIVFRNKVIWENPRY